MSRTKSYGPVHLFGDGGAVFIFTRAGEGGSCKILDNPVILKYTNFVMEIAFTSTLLILQEFPTH